MGLAAGWTFAFFNSKAQEERKARIERVNEQVILSLRSRAMAISVSAEFVTGTCMEPCMVQLQSVERGIGARFIITTINPSSLAKAAGGCLH